MGWWVSDLLRDNPVMLISWLLWVPLSICLHELGHGIAAIWQGDDTPIRLRRMTLNPLVHMGGMSLIMFAVVGIAWGMMPVNPYRFRWGRLGGAVVSAAGPAVNLILAFIALTTFALLDFYGHTQSNFGDNLGTFFWVGGCLNIVLAMFNLLPFPPLDGSRILAGLSERIDQFYANPEVQRLAFFALLAFFFFGFGKIYSLALDTASVYCLLVGVLFP